MLDLFFKTCDFLFFQIEMQEVVKCLTEFDLGVELRMLRFSRHRESDVGSEVRFPIVESKGRIPKPPKRQIRMTLDLCD